MAKSLFKRVDGLFRSKAPLKIGVVTSRSGPMDYYGTMQVRGLELGIEYATGGSWEVFGRTIRLLIEDDAGEPETGVQKARQLLEQEKVDILQGCPSSAVAIQIARIMPEHERLFLVEPAATDVLTGAYFNRNIFRTAANVSQDAAAGGKYAVEHLGRRFCFLSPDYIWGHQSRSAWWHVVEKSGGEIARDVLAAPDTTDFRPYLEQVLVSRAEVLVQSWAGAGCGPLFAQMRELGIFDIMRVTGGLGDREARHALGESAVGMIGPIKYSCVLPTNPVNDWLVRHHRERYAEDPDLFTGGGFAAGIALVEGLKRTGGDANVEALIPAMEGMSFEGPKGTYTFRREDHQALQPMYVAEMVKHPEQPYCIPRLIREISPEDCAPPLVKPRSDTTA